MACILYVIKRERERAYATMTIIATTNGDQQEGWPSTTMSTLNKRKSLRREATKKSLRTNIEVQQMLAADDEVVDDHNKK